MSQIIVVTGASSGFGNLTAKALAHSGHTVYAGMRDPAHGNPAVQALEAYSKTNDVDLRPVAPNVLSEDSFQAGISKIIHEAGRIDVLIHNAGHMTFGPAEAFTPEQLAAEYDVNSIGTHRVNRVVLPHMRKAAPEAAHRPTWVPTSAAKAAMDSLAVTYAGEPTLWGIETSIIVPGAYSKGTNHFAHAGSPADEQGPYEGIDKRILDGNIAVEPKDSDPEDVARAIVDVVAAPYGKRPFRVHVGTEADRSHVVNPVADFAREQTMKDMGVGELLNVFSVAKT